MLLDDCLVSNSSIQILLRLFVPLSLLPSHVDEFFLVGKHVFLIVLLDFQEHFVLKHPMEASLHHPILVSIHENIHAKFDCLSARFACIAVEGHFLQLRFVPDLFTFELFLVDVQLKFDLSNLFLELFSDFLLHRGLILESPDYGLVPCKSTLEDSVFSP